jgi:hypothetical protein
LAFHMQKMTKEPSDHSSMSDTLSSHTMADTNEGPVFRASKRRKVFRKRRDDDEVSDQDIATQTTSATTTVAASKQQQDGGTETREGSVSISHVRPLGLRKGGVAFSSKITNCDLQDILQSASCVQSHHLYATKVRILSSGNPITVWSPKGRLWCSGREAHQKKYLPESTWQ